MRKITYLLGAGASANALPLIKRNTNLNIAGLPDQLRDFISIHQTPILTINDKWTNEEITLLNKIAEKCVEFGTPDLYAKFLLETGNIRHYRILKSLLSIYFKYKQEYEERFDIRALNFLTTITQNQKIPDNIKILSWNYDIQIEMAAKKLKPIKPSGLDYVQGFTCWPNLSDGYEFKENPFLFHLNGVAGFSYSERNFVDKIKEHFHFKATMDKEILLSFAWEDGKDGLKRTFHEQRMNIAKQLACDTEILVVIGYSFPFFNRLIDTEIFKSMKSSLKKIYFQDPYNDGSQLSGQFDLSDAVVKNVVPISKVENYHIPYEL